MHGGFGEALQGICRSCWRPFSVVDAASQADRFAEKPMVLAVGLIRWALMATEAEVTALWIANRPPAGSDGEFQNGQHFWPRRHWQLYPRLFHQIGPGDAARHRPDEGDGAEGRLAFRLGCAPGPVWFVLARQAEPVNPTEHCVAGEHLKLAGDLGGAPALGPHPAESVCQFRCPTHLISPALADESGVSPFASAGRPAKSWQPRLMNG
jgi:hypothetical protein